MERSVHEAMMQTTTLLMLTASLTSLEHATKAVEADTNSAIGTGDHIELVRHFAKLREVNEAIKKARNALDELEDHMSYVDIPDCFKANRIKTTTIEDVGRVSVSYKWSCSILDGRKPEAFDWLRNGGNGSIIIETVNAQTLASFAKNEVEAFGREMPGSLFNVSLKPYTSITKV
jgi:hypothetical protein